MNLKRGYLAPTSNWRVAKLLWNTSRLRAKGRARRQEQLWGNKAKSSSNRAASWTSVFAILFAIIIQFLFGNIIVGQTDIARQIAEERAKEVIIISPRFQGRF